MNNNAITLRQLHAFIAVAETGGFRRAAERLYRSQSAITAQVRQLEDTLGVAVFHRTTRRVTLTAEGTRLLARARNALAELDAVVDDLRDEVALQRGRVSIATSPTISSTRLPHIIAAYQKAYPAIAVSVREDFASPVLDAVRNNEVDFAIGPRFERARELDFRPIAVDHFHAVLPPGDALGRRRRIAFADIVDRPMLAMPRASALRMVLDNIYRERGLSLVPRFEVSHHLTLMAMVEAGLGVTVLPAICLGAAGFRRLRTARLVDPPLARELGLITLRGQALSPAASRFAQMVERFFPERPAARAGARN